MSILSPGPTEIRRASLIPVNRPYLALLTKTLLAVILMSGLLGCASSGQNNDPLEPVNRQVFAFNNFVDAHALRPAAQAYRTITPDIVRTGVRNVFDNAGYPVVFVNQFLQGKVSRGAQDLTRFLVNTTLGLAGLIDVASPLGLEAHNEDFGQTFAVWGISRGPYLVVPFLGSYSLRSGVGALGNQQLRLQSHIEHVPTRNSVFVLWAIEQRERQLGRSSLLQGDSYLFLRDAYLQRREDLATDGQSQSDPFLDSQ